MTRTCAAVMAWLGACLWTNIASAQVRRADAPASASRWADSQLSMGSSANASLFDRSYFVSGDAVASWDFGASISPRFRVHRVLQLRAWWGFNMEVSNAYADTTERGGSLGDPSLSLWFDGIPAVGGLHVALSASLTAPVSTLSRASTMILAPGLLAQAHWEARVPGGTFHAIARVGWLHPFYEYSTAGVRGDRPYHLSCVGGGTSCTNQLSSRTNVHDQLAWSVTLAPAWGAWSPGVSFAMFHQWAFEATVMVRPWDTPGVDSHTRTYTDFATWLDLSPNAWLTLEAGYSLTRNLLDGDGTLGNPFYARYQDWRVYLSANVVIDRLVDVIRGRGRVERGVVRW